MRRTRPDPGKERKIADGEPAGSGSDPLIEAITACLDDNKAIDVMVIDLRGKSPMADYMVVASGVSARQVGALAQHLLRRLKQFGIIGITPEGLKQGDWVLIDAGDAIVHLFRPEIRDFYGIEKMWGISLGEPDRTTEAGG